MSADVNVGAPAVGAGTAKAAGAAGIVLMTLAAGQFVMALDTTVMNTAIATVAKDVGTTVTGIQTAITLYTLVMASLMITGGKVGQLIGRKRAFAIGCIIYACGSLTTALSQNLTVLMIGWSGLEGLGAVLIMPAIVALVASNFGKPDRPRAYGLVAAAGAIAAVVRPATENDRDFVVGLVPSLLEFGSPAWRSPGALRSGYGVELARALSSQDRRATFLIAETRDGTPLGFISLKVVASIESGERAHVADLAVTEAVRRRGVGTVLMRAGEASARELGFDLLSLDLWSTNETALAFYRRLGYHAESLTMFKRLE